ncbi:site-specific integrase [Shewanella sp. Arc9-LZ]|uniref:site-specific integrase n=1 Tax=Shewanella sp. Arc9-LZ TaxID=2698686 RepID=UPI00137BC9EF|nr:site-specific integrase [Shewanella sp. Arc9-LZ]QHS14682.1 site-specific integrase [Shewanella sp. Arc9-LZ]
MPGVSSCAIFGLCALLKVGWIRASLGLLTMRASFSNVDIFMVKKRAVMSLNRARKVTLPVFTLTETCDKEVSEATVKDNERYFYKPMLSDDGEVLNFNQVDMVISRDGSPWHDGCLFIWDRIIDKSDDLHVIQKSNAAGDIAYFREFIEDYSINYLVFPKNKMHRPTYRYRAYLKSKVRSAEIAKSTAQRFMQTTIAFYRWMEKVRGFKPEHPPWSESERFISFTDNIGFNRFKSVTTTDISIKGRSVLKETYKIIDGGRLRPLDMNEQKVLISSLIRLGNESITLIMLMSLFSGARIQTVLTLKVKHFNALLSDDVDLIKLLCGSGTSVDTKSEKNISIEYPRWLHDFIIDYIFSDKITKRRKKWLDKTLRDNVSHDDAYVFLTNRGSPYYEDSVERNIFNPNQKTRSRPDGSTVRTFIAETLLPMMRIELGLTFSFKFHDLRATFGMNLTDSLLLKVELGEMTLTQVRNLVRDRMGHDSYTVTDGYLDYRQDIGIVNLAQSEYEKHLKELIQCIKEGVHG